ncbi:glycoside hydrolase family 30 [Gigaspora margarita]|uniref:Glycoside hydrolase family 30 n=1 Tax=Gigaspora margarita TaxID=4874 RepID=A0A8H3X6G9_GIGMA|nr:glycoside hydrolase family 30 [Gigaspora margarita]
MTSNFIIQLLFTISILLSIANANKTVFIDPNDCWQIFEGWGTMLSWWTNGIGGFPNDYKNLLADLAFDPEKGLGLNVIRFVIPGGDNPTHHHIRPEGNVPGYWPCSTCNFNFSADEHQRWALFASLKRGANIFEANSASPPYWMTKSNCSSGSVDGTSDNLDPSYYDAFAKYLAEVVNWYKIQGINFRTISPFNEPSAGWWKAFGYQEGCHFICSTMNTIIKKVADNLIAKGLTNTSISIADEYSIDQEVFTINCIDSTTKSYVSQYNVHGYGGSQRTELYNITKKDGKKLWMSEYGLPTTSDMSASITLSEQILNDMRNMKTNAWVYLQAIQDVGYQIISSDDNDTLAAYSAKDQKLVIVCTNKGAAQFWNFNVNMFNISNITAFRTSDNNETLTPLSKIPPINKGSLVYLHPSDSITTWVFDATLNF